MNLSNFRRASSRLLQAALLVGLCLNFCGCMSSAVVDAARTRRFVDENGEVVKIEKGKPGLYWWLPVTIPLDAAPYTVWKIIESETGGHALDSSPKKSGGLRVSH